MRRIVITGCSGGGKSSLIKELSIAGHTTVEEPGRRVIASERANGGTGFPWADAERFANLAFWMAVGDHAAATADLTFFDRSALDQAAWFARQGTVPPGEVPRYDPLVFLVPPWPEIYVTDADRQHGFGAALEEYTDLTKRLREWGYRCELLPKAPVTERADFVLKRIPREVAA